MKKFLLILALLISLFAGFVSVQYFYGGDPASAIFPWDFEVIAHKGVHQKFDKTGLTRHTCTATRIYKPQHRFLENTMDSVEAAFHMGATMVEIDVRRTTDGHLVVFGDEVVDCRTEGRGLVAEYTLEDLQELDVGYGYTHDGGVSYPFRGKGLGGITELEYLLKQFPEGKFLIDHMDRDMESAQALVDVFHRLPTIQQRNMYYSGPLEIYDFVHEQAPLTKRLFASEKRTEQWILSYFHRFGLGGLSNDAMGEGLLVSPEYTVYLWGWPYRFLGKVIQEEARFYLLINTIQGMKEVETLPIHGIMTDYIEDVGQVISSE